MDPALYRSAVADPGAGGSETGWRVRLAPGSGLRRGFDGPLELLLRMARDGRADPLRIRIAPVTRQYLEALEVMEMLDLEVGSEFLKLATALLRLKARRMVPRPPPPAPVADDDPLARLEARLAEYARYRAAAARLRESLEGRRSVWSRPPLELSPAAGREIGPAPAMRGAEGTPLDLFAVVEAFRRVVARARARPAPPLPKPRVPVAELQERFEAALPPGTVRDFEELLLDFIGPHLAGPSARPALVAAFLALLELARQGRVSVLQEEAFGPIRIVGVAPEPAG